tara:strand:+ start:1300 stop:2268 length:969 start_codon:yes stop_codon:yes gene_type:complete
MINSVRQTVLSVLNKNNYGYITPADFNLYAKQAQLEIFDEYFYQYNYQLNKENARQSGTDYANIARGLAEVIDTFSVTKALRKTAASVATFNNNFYLPSEVSTGEDYYLINKVFIYTSLLTSGEGRNGGIAKNLADITGTFISSGVSVGDVVVNIFTENFAYVTDIPSETLITLSEDIFPEESDRGYRIYDADVIRVSDRLTHDKVTLLNMGTNTKPSLIFPAHVEEGELLTAFPASITDYGQVFAQYIRYPKTPKWTYNTLSGDEPVFDGTAADYQDFELPADDEYSLVNKILQYSGMSIREIQTVQFGQAQEQAQDVNEK